MMSSRVLSRLLPVADGDVSVYESMRRDASRPRDVEARGGLLLDEAFHDDDEDPEALLYEAREEPAAAQEPKSKVGTQQAQDWLEPDRQMRTEEDDLVPESLLLDTNMKNATSRPTSGRRQSSRQARNEALWKTVQERHGLHSTRPSRHTSHPSARLRSAAAPDHTAAADPRADAMWLYTNANNLDAFLLEVYQYYVNHGVWSIMLARAIGLLQEAFVFSFAMFLTTCIDYSKVPLSKSTSEVLIPKCMAKASWIKNAGMFVYIIYWCIRLTSHITDSRRLFRMHDFYLHVLGINDQDIQTVSWVRVVEGLVRVQNANIATANPGPAMRKYTKYSKPQQRMNAETIANRLMRQANYYVAIYNKDILDFTLPLPFVGSRQFYSRSLEWCIDFCLTNFIFDEQGSIRPFCLDVRNRKVLVSALQMRLRFAALTSILVAPFNIVRFCIIFFFQYYTEFTRNPSKVSARSFTPFAEWKIREFNELDHLFRRRLRGAYPFATEYLRQFPKDKTDQACRFIAFISGAIAAVLALATLFDPELFLGFEVTPGRTAVFWFTIMIGTFGVAHGSLPDESEVHDPVLHLKEVLLYTHYMPAHWKERLHSNEVRSEFSAMYQMKVLIFLEEILSFIVAPWILLRNAGKRSERIVDFFREHTVHVDGIGYQCNFGVFGFKKDLNAEDPTALIKDQDGLRDDYYGLKDDKMQASVQNFMQYYSHYNHHNRSGPGGRRPGAWQPPPTWPPMLSPAAIAENPAEAGKAQTGGARPTSSDRAIPRKGPGGGGVHHSTKISRGPRSPGAGHISESRIMANDSDLHEYGDVPRDQLESDTDVEEGADKVGTAGVLGMLNQMVRAQAERPSGVGL